MYIFDAETVSSIIENTLRDESKFTPLSEDPRKTIRSNLNGLLDECIDEGTILKCERFLIIGKTEQDGHSHSHDFVMTKPHTYPLFKGHKLKKEDFDNKVIPPTRMVTAAINGPTYRLGLFLNHILKSVAEKYCEGEVVQDSTHFIQEVQKLGDEISLSDPGLKVGTLDVDALYPNIDRSLAMEALQDALQTCTDYTQELNQAILRLVDFCLQNSVIHYRGQWFRSEDGVPTGGPESGSIANIYVKWMLDKKLLPHPTIAPKDKMEKRLRFLDDLWFLWRGSERQFEAFKSALNTGGRVNKFTLKGEVGKTVDFLDITVSLENGSLETSVFIKPTDSKRYLNRRSDHTTHTFGGIPFSQFRRAVVISSNDGERQKSVEYMEKKFIDSGYSSTELQESKERALALDRDEILANHRSSTTDEANEEDILTFVINHDPAMASVIRRFLDSRKEILHQLIGERKIIISERRGPNTASLLFAKSGFSSQSVTPKENQRSNARGCLLCDNLMNDKFVNTNGLKVKLDFTLNCKSKNCIYVALCRYCNDKAFYFGQTTTPLHIRFNGHRGCFKTNNFKFNDSALSHHIYTKHLENFDSKLLNFKIGIVRSCSAVLLNRLEDYFIYSSKADIISLNRYKVVT